eukprot:CAMPEP_0198681168 /NCGR_PEP_ID=MMETSP1468-20131203/6289_1 /TAXON_ID=1461545 /ORGANISM="Mantoniella sp, Strain CCMP1436" /LENGTH=34 /DNA_ID= /DNA_START= /DNA_END= /DNA_ORIENTATION=
MTTSRCITPWTPPPAAGWAYDEDSYTCFVIAKIA